MKHTFTLIKLFACQPTRPAELERSWKPRRRHAKSAFTLIELLVVIAIIGILASVVVVNVGSSRIKARDARRISDLTSIATALDLYFDDKGHYPYSADGLVPQAGSQCVHDSVVNEWNSFKTLLSPYSSNIPSNQNGIRYCNGLWFSKTTENYQLVTWFESRDGNGLSMTQWNTEAAVYTQKAWIVQK